MDNQSKVTAFFGGSFDPPHSGHLAVARGALATGLCGHILWVPAYAPPHKLDAERASFADRMEMVKLLISGEKNMSVSDIEAVLGRFPSYTIGVLEAVEAETGMRPALLIGADSLLQLHSWHRGDELAAEYTVLTYPRKNFQITRETLSAIWGGKIGAKLFAGVMPGKFFEISSTEIRNSMEKSQNTGNIKSMTENLPQIDAYITEHRLYGKK